MIAAKTVIILMPVTVLLSFFWAPRASLLGESGRILYFHVPLAWVAVLAFIVSGSFSLLSLTRAGKNFAFLDEKSGNSASIGFLFSVLTVLTGSLWAKATWGSYWNWDPRETTAVILLMIYIAYFSLRTSLSDNSNKQKICASYLILAMAAVPFLVFIIPRMVLSLHPDPIINPQKKIFLDDRIQITLIFSIITFTLLYFYLLNLLNRISIIKKRIEEKDEI